MLCEVYFWNLYSLKYITFFNPIFFYLLVHLDRKGAPQPRTHRVKRFFSNYWPYCQIDWLHEIVPPTVWYAKNCPTHLVKPPDWRHLSYLSENKWSGCRASYYREPGNQSDVHKPLHVSLLSTLFWTWIRKYYNIRPSPLLPPLLPQLLFLFHTDKEEEDHRFLFYQL